MGFVLRQEDRRILIRLKRWSKERRQGQLLKPEFYWVWFSEILTFLKEGAWKVLDHIVTRKPACD